MIEFSKPGRDPNYLKTYKSTLDFRKTYAAKIHMQQKTRVLFPQLPSKNALAQKMYNPRVRKYTRSKCTISISTQA